MEALKRIAMDPAVMGGRACVRGTRVTVSTILELMAAGHDSESILKLYPYLQADDIREAVQWAAWRAQEKEVVLSAP